MIFFFRGVIISAGMPADFTYQFYRTSKEAMQAMQVAILAAQKSIYWELYSLFDDEVGNPVIDLLCAKARTGVEVKLIIDSLGSFEMSNKAIERLRVAGVDVLIYNKMSFSFNPYDWWKYFAFRNHRKVLIIDQEIVFIGGVNVGKMYSGWNDLHVRMQGQLAAPILCEFAKVYVRCGGDKKAVRHLLKNNFLWKRWNDFRGLFRYVLHNPIGFGKKRTSHVFHDGLRAAKRSFYLISPYFIPSLKIFKLIKQAKARGVEVNLFLPLHPDWKILEWAAIWYYRLAHKAGANIFLLKKMHHGKAMLVDKVYGFIGSANLTFRSLNYNEEAGLIFKEELMVNELQQIFDDFRQGAVVVSVENVLKNSCLMRFKTKLGKFFTDTTKI